MAYNSNIPQPTDQLSVSQGDILNNFQALATVVLANNGATTYPNQGVAPVFPANQDGFYAKVPGGSFGALSEMYVSKNIFGGGTSQIPFTASILSTATPTINSSGWTYLPSGIVLQWGSFTVNDNSNNFGPNNFSITFPHACLQIIVSSSNGNPVQTAPTIFVVNGTVTTTGFNVCTRNGISGNNSQCNYLAIGY